RQRDGGQQRAFEPDRQAGTGRHADSRPGAAKGDGFRRAGANNRRAEDLVMYGSGNLAIIAERRLNSSRRRGFTRAAATRGEPVALSGDVKYILQMIRPTY